MTNMAIGKDTGKRRVTLLSRFRFSAVDTLLSTQRELRQQHDTTDIVRKKTSLRAVSTDLPPTCLHCDEEMVVYHRPTGDQWACCPNCGYANDVPGILSDGLHCSYREAVELLVFQHNLHDVDKEETERLVQQRLRYDRLAALIRERLYQDYAPSNTSASHGLNPVALEKLLERLDLLQYVDDGVTIELNLKGKDGYVNKSKASPERDISSEWQSPLLHATDFFGIEYFRRIESWFYPKLIDPITNAVRPNGTPNRLFHGLRWDLVLVIPLLDVPGRFCGILCIGREGSFPDDYVLRLLPDETGNNPGFIMPFRNFRAIVRSEERGDARLLAYNNPLHLVRTLLAHRHARLSLPLIGWIDYFTSAPRLASSDWSPFRMIPSKTFWLQSYDPITLRSIIEQDGKIVHYNMETPYPGIKEAAIFGQPAFRPSPMALAKMPVDAIPWQRYLSRQIGHQSLASMEKELLKITVTSQRYQTILAQLPPTKKVKALRKQLQQPMRRETVQVGIYEVHAEPSGLFRRTGKQELEFVADTVCRLDCVFFDPRRNKKIYRGYVRYGDRTIRFETPLTEFKQRPIETIRNVVKKTGLPEPTFRCKDRFYRLATEAMSRLKTVRPIRFAGWNGKIKSLELPQFRITQRGIMSMPDRARTLIDDFPAREIDASVFRETTQLPGENEMPVLTAAVPFLVACELIALRPMRTFEELPLIVTGGNLTLLEHLARFVGIPIARTESDRDVRKILNHNERHRWPLFVSGTFDPETMFIRQLGKSKSPRTIYYHPELEKARHAAKFQSNMPLLRLDPLPEVDENYWQDRLPPLRTLFFDRLKYHVVNPKELRSSRTFLQRECALWKDRLLADRLEAEEN